MKTIDVADQMIGKVQSLCQSLRADGFQCAANDLEDTFIILYDRILPHLASNTFDNNTLVELGGEMADALNKLETITRLVDYKERILQIFNGVNRGS